MLSSLTSSGRAQSPMEETFFFFLAENVSNFFCILSQVLGTCYRLFSALCVFLSRT